MDGKDTNGRDATTDPFQAGDGGRDVTSSECLATGPQQDSQLVTIEYEVPAGVALLHASRNSEREDGGEGDVMPAGGGDESSIGVPAAEASRLGEGSAERPGVLAGGGDESSLAAEATLDREDSGISEATFAVPEAQEERTAALPSGSYYRCYILY